MMHLLAFVSPQHLQLSKSHPQYCFGCHPQMGLCALPPLCLFFVFLFFQIHFFFSGYNFNGSRRFTHVWWISVWVLLPLDNQHDYFKLFLNPLSGSFFKTHCYVSGFSGIHALKLLHGELSVLWISVLLLQCEQLNTLLSIPLSFFYLQEHMSIPKPS